METQNLVQGKMDTKVRVIEANVWQSGPFRPS